MKNEQGPTNGLLGNAIIRRLCAFSCEMVILVDHDGLASSSVVFERLVRNGFDLYDYTDNLSLYFYLENKRKISPASEDLKLLIRISAELDVQAQIPYSILKQSEIIHLRLDDFFKGIVSKAVRELPSQYYEKLFELLQVKPKNLTSYNDSIDFLTRSIFGIDIAGIITEAQFWVILFKLHYTDTELPEFIVNKLLNADIVYMDEYDIDLVRALKSREYFYAFLQKEWKRFVDRRTGCAENPMVLPFDHPDLKVYTDNFFAEAMLQPISLDENKAHDLGWMECGIAWKTPDVADQVKTLISSMQIHLPEADCAHKAWQRYAKDYAEFLFRFYSADNSELTTNARELMAEVNSKFLSWMQ